jgi:ABC-2 type transport system permease protein
MDRLPSLVPGIGPAERALLLKDFRTFRRDPRQWGQMLVFLVLLGFYFSSLRRMFPGDIGWVFRNGLSLMNLMVVGMLLCASCGRFIFPLISLEGKRVWLLGLTPLPRWAWLRGKMAFSVILCILFALPLLLYSDISLGMPPTLVLLHQFAGLCLAFGLSALSAGLGAVWPNFREKDPSKIAVGYGGTLSLILGLAYLLGLVGLVAAPWHILAGLGGNGQFPWWGWLIISPAALLGAGLAFLAITVPMHLGRLNLQEQEF